MTTACYLRVSSDLQAKANGCDSQRHAIERWAAGQGIEAASLIWFEDSAVSGKSMDRAAWNAMMARVRAREFGCICMYDLSRAGRTLKGLIEWADEMRALNVPVVFLSEGIDLRTPVGELMFAVIASVSQFLRKLTAEKISAGIRAKQAAGHKWARARAPRYTDEQYAAMKARLDAGEGFDAIRAEMGLSRQWLAKRLTRA